MTSGSVSIRLFPPAVAARLRSAAAFVLVLLIRTYQGMVRPFLVGACKFHPTCSEYAIEALHAHGVRRGLWLTLTRVMRCHPFSPGGMDPVPQPANRAE